MGMRTTKGFAGWIIIGLAVALACFHVYTGIMGIFESRIQRGVHLLFIVPLAFLLYPATKKSPDKKIPWYDWVLAFLSMLPSLYVVLFREVLNARWENASPVSAAQIVLGIIIVVMLIEAVRRAVAPALALLMVLAVLELVFGHLVPGTFAHRKLGLERIIEICYLLQEEGIYGYVTGTSAVFVALFVVFGSFINKVGLGKYFIDLAFRTAGRSAGGPAKVAVLSSGLFGTISGSATANVFATGIFTIPMMKKLGYRAEFAGAVEAAASTGGGLVPPIMGAAVFLMAQITKIPYITICAAALPTALFYYLCVFFTVHFEAKKNGLQVAGASDVKVISWKILLRDSYLLFPIVVLVIFLFIGYSPMKAAFYGIITCIFVSLFNPENRITPKRFLETLIDGGKNIVMIGASCAGAGLIVSIITNTGIGLSFSSLVINLAQGQLIVALFLVMISSIVLGMGLPTTASYVLTIAIGGPILIELGGETLAVHMFVFYYAILATVTPPVAMAAYAGASIAGGNPLVTAFESSRLAAAGYIVPFLFFFNSGILLDGGLANIIVSIVIALQGIFLVTIALGGFMLTRVSWPERFILLALAIFIPFPIILTNMQSLILGCVVIALMWVLQKNKVRRLRASVG
jgi:TRAP transporter 4TM/12TM fusion protein